MQALQEELAVGGSVWDVQKPKVAEAPFGKTRTEIKPKPRLRRFGRYIVLDVLGQGGMGVVLKGYDEDLNRQVALKVLHSDPTEREGQRLKREAQALAKLAHPNVVQVFEVGETEGQVFVAMELVKGQTLRQWQSERDSPRGWKECVEIYLQAGQGLAAAHAKGLVHRDFKPDNCIVDDEQRVRVLDFGLVRQVEAGELDESWEDGIAGILWPKDDALGSLLTGAGKVVGTIPYMSPEQFDGKFADARSDQFSFCVSLCEAVYGKRPFKGKMVVALAMSANEGVVWSVSKRAKVPMKLRQALLRGLCADPEQRWESMEALLAELREVVAPRTRRWLVMGLASGLAALSGALALGHYVGVMSRCTGASAELHGIWDEGRRQDVKAAILGTELVFAPITWERVEVRLDDYAQAWVDKHTEVCEATWVRQEQTEEEMSLRMGCLRKRKADLNAIVTVLADADVEVVENVVELVADLPTLSPRCDDTERLLEQRQRVSPPEDPQVAEEVEALRDRLADVTVEAEVGEYAQAHRQLQLISDQANSFGYIPLVAEIGLAYGYVRYEKGQYVEAEKDLTQSYLLATEQGYDDVALNSAIGLSLLVSDQYARYAEGELWSRIAFPLARRSGETADVVASVTKRADALLRQGRVADAEGVYRRALQMWEGTLREDDLDVADILVGLGRLLLEAPALEGQEVLGVDEVNVREAEFLLGRALRIKERFFGAEHPGVGTVVCLLGDAMMRQGRHESAELQYQRALQLWWSESSDIERIKCIANLGASIANQDRYSDAEGVFLLALQEGGGGPLDADPLVEVIVLRNLWFVLYEQGKLVEAEQCQKDLFDLLEFESESDPERYHLTMVNTRVWMARLHLGNDEVESARFQAQQAIFDQLEGGRIYYSLSEARFVLARALWSDRGERSRARRLAEQARDAFTENGQGSEEDLTEVEHWLREHQHP